MDALLSFLLSVVDYIYFLFGRGWSILWNVVNNVRDWLTSLFTDLQIWVFNFVGTLIAEVRDEIQAVAGELTQLFTEAVNYANELFNHLLDYVSAWIHDTVTYLEAELGSFYNALLSRLSDLRDWAASMIQAAINGLRSDLVVLVSSVTIYVPFLKDLSAVLSNGGLIRLTDLLHNLYDRLLTFVQDPVGYILSLLWNDILTFISYAVAYALGSVNTDLPPVPSWGKGGKS